MSYDLAIFEPRGELRDRAVFLDWFRSRVRWNRLLDYNDSSNAIEPLRRWLVEMRAVFPPINGLQQSNVKFEGLADYVIGTDLVFVAFQSLSAEAAYDTAYRLAAKHHVGFFDVSGDGQIWFPTSNYRLELIDNN